MLRRDFKLMLSQWYPKPIRQRLSDRHPITERVQCVSLKTRLCKWRYFSAKIAPSVTNCNKFALTYKIHSNIQERYIIQHRKHLCLATSAAEVLPIVESKVWSLQTKYTCTCKYTHVLVFNTEMLYIFYIFSHFTVYTYRYYRI